MSFDFSTAGNRRFRRMVPGAVACALLIAACGGSSGDAATSDSNDDQEVAASDGACVDFGFTGTASRSLDEGFGHVAGTYTGDDFIDARSAVKDGVRAAMYVASFEMPVRFLGAPDVPEGGVVMKFDVDGLDTLSPGDSYDNSSGRLPLISNGGSGGNAGNYDDIRGTVTLLEFNADKVCVEVDYEDDFHRIIGVISVPNEAL